LNGRLLRNAPYDVLDRGVEGRRARSNGAALNQDALIRGQLEPGIQNPVHAARLAGTGRVRIDLLRADLAANGERDRHEREPTEGGGLPVVRAPAAHAGCQVAAAAVLGAEHGDSPLSWATPAVV